MVGSKLHLRAMRKPAASLVYWLVALGCLAACRAPLPPAPPATVVLAPVVLPWVATIADRLYERQLLNAAGRDALKQRIATQRLQVYYEVPSSGNQFADEQTDPATVLAFCTQAFEAELTYRIAGQNDNLFSDVYIAGQVLDTAAVRVERQRLAKLMQGVNGDTAALFRQLASPGQLLEEKIPAEDTLVQTGWTIYPPLGRSDSLAHPIADSRSIFGKTRTRTARDLYELGLVTAPQYAVLQQELASGQLATETMVCHRAAQLALDVVAYPTRRAAFDSLLTRLTQTGVLSGAGRQRALADSQVVQSLDLFKLLPYCERARVVALAALPHSPRRAYPQLLTKVAALYPAFRYAAVSTGLVETYERENHYLKQHVTLAFTASGRRYRTAFEQGYRLDGPVPAGATNVAEEFVTLVNQWLRDQGAAERLYAAYTPDKYSVHGDDYQGLVLLTPTQRAAWGLASNLFGGVSEVPTFTSARIEQSLALYQRLGIMAGLSATELREGHRRALQGNIGSYAALLACFPRLLVYTGGEDAEEPGAYGQAVSQVAARSRGAFHPTRIRDDLGGQQGPPQRSTLAFMSGGRSYRATLTSDLGWMINDITKLLRRAVRETTTGQLYYLGWGDETGLYLFLTARQAAALRRAQPKFFRENDEEAVLERNR